MLSDEKIEELWVDIHKGKFMHAGFNTFARAIEAAVLPEGWVAVPKEPTLAMLDCLRSDITSNLEKRYQAMLAAAPKAQAEKQEPVKDAPVAWRFSKGTITKLDSCPHGGNWQPLYIHPQPDLTAEVEFMQGKYEEMLEEWLPQKQRIAALEEAAREAREALSSCGVSETDGSDYYNRYQVGGAISKLDVVLGND